jgi:hypothetical protein
MRGLTEQIEYIHKIFLDRVLEDHECIVDIVSQWPRETDNQIVFTIRRDKYVLFKNPQVQESMIAIFVLFVTLLCIVIYIIAYRKKYLLSDIF